MTRPSQTSGDRLAYIDALRGYAILGVIAFHTLHSASAFKGPIATLITSGQHGVQLFFVASALTLLISWRGHGDGAAPFYIRRLFRIAPMFWLAIAFYTSLYGLAPRASAPDGVTVSDVLATAAFVHGWHPRSINSIVPGGWSIAVEMTFYLAFPLLATLANSGRRAIVALAAAVWIAKLGGDYGAKFLAPLFPDQSPFLIDAFLYFWFFNQLPVFFVGFLVYFALQSESARKFLGRATLALSLALMGLLSFVASPGSEHLEFAFAYGLFAASLGTGAGGLLVNGPIRRLGQISYSAYLWHFGVLAGMSYAIGAAPLLKQGANAVRPGLLYVALLAVELLILVPLCLLSQNLVESPMIAIGGRMARLARGRSQPAGQIELTPP